MLFYGWPYDLASCINEKSRVELPSSHEAIRRLRSWRRPPPSVSGRCKST